MRYIKTEINKLIEKCNNVNFDKDFKNEIKDIFWTMPINYSEYHIINSDTLKDIKLNLIKFLKDNNISNDEILPELSKKDKKIIAFMRSVDL